MRPLTEVETKTLFEKLATYCGKGISNLIADPSSKSDRYVFRIQVCISISAYSYFNPNRLHSLSFRFIWVQPSRLASPIPQS